MRAEQGSVLPPQIPGRASRKGTHNYPPARRRADAARKLTWTLLAAGGEIAVLVAASDVLLECET